MTQVICTNAFHGVHRRVDFPVYHAACDEFMKLHSDGAVNGNFIVQFGDRQDSSSVFATVWRSVDVDAPGWEKSLEKTDTPFKYSKGFNPAVVTPAHVVSEVRALLLSE